MISFALGTRREHYEEKNKNNVTIPSYHSICENVCKHKNKKEGKDQVSIQSSTTPDPGYQCGSYKLTIRRHKRETRGQPFPSWWPQGIDKQARTKA